jgi:nicotinamide mononucleotide transporter
MLLKNMSDYFTKKELLLWIGSILTILISFILFKGDNTLSLIASLIGVTSLIFCAKGNPFGQFLIIIFSLLYGIISFSYAYYGEMITYLGMTAPIALFSMITWLKNPYEGNKSEVEVKHLKLKDIIPMIILTVIVTFVFYFILDYFNTANLIPSTFSVTTSFLAIYLTTKRSPFYAVAYAANDLVLIVLWSIAAKTNITYVSVVVCFAVFLLNDIYGFINWQKMHKRQTTVEMCQ